MRFSMSEQNTHTVYDEYGRADEKNAFGENQINAEHEVSNELILTKEIQDTDSVKPRNSPEESNDGAKKISALTRYLSLISVSIAALLTAGLAYFSSPKITVRDELIGFNSYSCTMEFPDAQEELTAELKCGGEQIASLPISKGQEALDLKFDGLIPERDYTITFTDKDGKEQYSHSFKTDPFVSFAPESDGKITFALHKSLSSSEGMALDMGLWLYDSEGKDFSSTVYFDPEGTNYIISEFLYSDTYLFTAEFYTPDSEEPMSYTKELTAGIYAKPEFEMTKTDTELIFTLMSGDISFYTSFNVEISNDEHYYSFSGEDITADGSNITAQLTQTIESGNYNVYIWGNCDSIDPYISNQIYKTAVSFQNAGNGSGDQDLVTPFG